MMNVANKQFFNRRDIKSVRSFTVKASSIVFNFVPILRPKNQQLIPSPLCLFSYDDGSHEFKAYSDDEANKTNHQHSKTNKEDKKDGNHKSTTGLPSVTLKPKKKKQITDDQTNNDEVKVKGKRSQMKKHSILQSLQDKKTGV